MALHHNSHHTKGFTLLEVMVVIAFVAIMGTVGAYFGIDALRGHAFHADRDVLVSVLQHARSQSIGNICLGATCTDGKPHGVAIQADKFITFQGASYATRDADVDADVSADPNIAHGGSVSEIVFTRLSATTTGGTISLTDVTGRTSVITISTEGQIIWTN
jgi:prepilin-type N-terminal cleavage/methylation domain-containing protein